MLTALLLLISSERRQQSCRPLAILTIIVRRSRATLLSLRFKVTINKYIKDL